MAYTVQSVNEKSAKVFNLSEDLSVEALDSIAKDIRSTIESDKNVEFFVLNFGPRNLEFKLLRPLTLLGTELKPKKKKLCVLAELRSVHNLIASEGLTGVIHLLSNLDELPSRNAGSTVTGKRKTTIDVGFINPFIDGVIHVFKVQARLDCAPGKPFLKDPSNPLPTSDIAGVIGISSPSFRGTISICFPEKTFLLLISSMLGETYTEITKDVEDGAGETLNMIFGYAKRILNERGYGIDKAIPTVVRGQNVSLSHLSQQGTIVLPFKVNDLDFYMEICTERRP